MKLVYDDHVPDYVDVVSSLLAELVISSIKIMRARAIKDFGLRKKISPILLGLFRELEHVSYQSIRGRVLNTPDYLH
jgi:hypothetical protein